MAALRSVAADLLAGGRDHSRPPPRSRVLKVAHLAVRAALHGDLADLEIIERRGFAAEGPWDRAALENELALPEAAVDLALREGVAAGYASWRRGVGEVELLRVAVLPEHRRHGIAIALIEHGLATPAARASERVHLEVREGNRAARALYERVGFKLVGRRPRYYPNGDTAILYSLGIVK